MTLSVENFVKKEFFKNGGKGVSKAQAFGQRSLYLVPHMERSDERTMRLLLETLGELGKGMIFLPEIFDYSSRQAPRDLH